MAPLAPQGAVPAAGGLSLMSDHLCGREAGRSGVAWPSATIPARVKKLSWDDASPDGQNKVHGIITFDSFITVSSTIAANL